MVTPLDPQKPSVVGDVLLWGVSKRKRNLHQEPPMGFRSMPLLLAVVAATGCTCGMPTKLGVTEKEYRNDYLTCMAQMNALRTQGREAPRWTYYDWCMQEKGYRVRCEYCESER